jgi:hypothetical protein
MKKLMLLFIFVGIFSCEKDGKEDTSCSFFDEFDNQINTTSWTISSESWTVSSGELAGYWSWSSAQTDQAVILLDDSKYNPTSYTASVKVKVNNRAENCGEKFILRSSPGNQMNINFNYEMKTVSSEYRSGGSYYTQLESVEDFSSFKNEPGDINEYELVKSGANITVYVNGSKAFSLEDTYFNGETILGLGAYGSAYYDSFCIK